MSNNLISLEDGLSVLTLPRGDGNGVLNVDVSSIYNSLRRIDEIRRATPMTAADLITEFNLAMVRASKLLAILELETAKSESKLKEAKSYAILDRVEEILKEKKHKSTADTREAALNIDEDVIKARDISNQLNTLSSYYGNKYHELKEALYATKKVADYYLKVPEADNFGGSK